MQRDQAQSSLKAKREFYTGKRGYKVGDTVDPTDINLNMKTMCFASAIAGADQPLPKFKVTLNANGGTGDDIASETESLFRLPNCTFTAPANQEFKGWSEDKGGLSVKAVGTDCSIVQDTTYYAIWQNIKSTIKFNANGGSGSMADVKVDQGTEYTLPGCAFTAPAGKEFKGWSLDKSSVISKVTAADLTIYALWQDLPAVSEEPEVKG